MVSDKNLLILSFFGFLIPFFYYVKIPGLDEKPRIKIVVGVLSNFNNFEQRKIIRSTWKRILPDDVKFHFLLGDTFCPYHQLWRLQEDHCREWKLEIPPWLRDGKSLSLLETEKQQSKRNNKPYFGFSFRVMRFPVVFEGLGILSSALRTLIQDFNITKITINLRERYGFDIISSVTFNQSDISKKHNNTGFIYKHFNERSLPTVDFDGVLSLKMEHGSQLKFPSKLCNAVYDYSLGKHGLVHINGLIDEKISTILPFSKYSCPLVSLKYRVLDVLSLKKHFGAKKTQNSVELKKYKEFKKLLDREEEDNNDMIFLPVLDSKFNNSQKLLYYSKYLTENFNFDHLILTDDASFLFINNILPKLNSLSSSLLWWSAFDVLTKTEDTTDKYTSLTYPPLPQSQTMVLSQYIVEYLGNNYNFLKQFSSLQSSIGIWLSGIETKRYQDTFWNLKNCQNLEIDKNFLACSNLNSDHMKDLWRIVGKKHF